MLNLLGSDILHYEINLKETRLAADDRDDDVALFDVSAGNSDCVLQVPVYLSPLFRLIHMPVQPSPDERREMVAALGARAIVEHLQDGGDLSDEVSFVFGTKYPGAPHEPRPLKPYEQVRVRIGA